MKFVIKNISEVNIINLARKIGYHFQGKNKEKSELIFIRALERSGYPRFHIFITENPDGRELIFNLHLDQKRPIYKYAPAHAGEYEGETVEKEAERIRQTIQK